ncbi:MAG: glycosyltransferase [Candidatus Moraniibacteriota bacterium]|nr:MAG: glycosyltransferase [Candidatus Moranbacteria bacterium]
MKPIVLLFQPYLRQHILNFGRGLQKVDFVWQQSKTKKFSYASLPDFDREMRRRKDSWFVRLRRILGIPNIRIKLTTSGDVLFTYGCFLFSNRPFVTYLETGLAPFSYDVGIAKNPIARFIIALSILSPQCKQLIFMSEASRKSFFASVHYPSWITTAAAQKACVVYPLVDTTAAPPKGWSGSLKLLFAGLFYMKGGIELAHGFEALRKKNHNVTLTIITVLRMIKEQDLNYLRSIPGLTLIDAKLNEAEMREMYRTHDIFVLPTFREGFGLVLIEALAHGMPIIATDQYATTEMVIDNENGFVYPDHPLKDYDPETYRMLGKYYSPADFYTDLFRFQDEGKMKPIESFIETSVERFLLDHTLLSRFSQSSIELYERKFAAQKISDQIEAVFLEAASGK